MGISREEALDCFNSDDLVGIGMEADAARRRLHPEGVVGYVTQAQIDCAELTADTPGAELDRLYRAVSEASDRGVRSLRLLNCNEPSRVERLLAAIRRQAPALWIECLSPGEVQFLSAALGLSTEEMLTRLMGAGLNSLVDDGVLLAGEQDHCGPSAIAQWFRVHRTAHKVGMRTIAGMTFGGGETGTQRVEFLLSVRELQQETGGFAAVAPAAAVAPGGRELDGVTAVERLKTLAIARMVLDNVDTVQARVKPQDLKVLQTSLRFGANDLGPVTIEDPYSEEEISRIIRDADFHPAQRTMGYGAMLLA